MKTTNAKRLLLDSIVRGDFYLLTDRQIGAKLKLGRRESLAVRDMLDALCREGELLRDSKNRYGTAEQFGAKLGRITGSERGFGFFTPDDGSDDLFLPAHTMKTALHGDRVLAICVGGRQGDEGEILAVISHGFREAVGTFRREGRGGVLLPDEKRLNVRIRIPSSKCKNCPDGAKAVAAVSFGGNELTGEIVEVLGESGDFFVEERAIIRAHELREAFPEPVVREAEAQAKRNPDDDLKGRVDLRNKLIITVDSEDTRDIDDAISVKKKGDLYELGVHIADVSHYVARNGAIDHEAFARGTSVYFPDRVLPMLPTALSNDICSLNEGVDRLTLSCFMTVTGTGKVIKKRVARSVIRSAHRMTYTAVTAIAEGEAAAVAAYPDLVEMVNVAAELTKILTAAREKRGGVALDIREAKILYENGKISIPEAPRTISHEMIEQFMVLANESVATLMTEKKLPFIYRVHARPSEEKATDFATFLKEAGVRVRFDPRNVSPSDYRDLLRSLEGSPLFPLVNRVMLRSMMKAVYAPENEGHFGLASDCYCHFTSPIRRYPDLCIHRIIKAALTDQNAAQESYRDFVKTASVQSSACERNAAEAERDVDALYIVAYMQDKIGEEYEATVSGVTAYGVFAELANTVEGFIPIETLPDDNYEYNDEKFFLRGMRLSFRLGERVRVKVAAVDWGARRVHFLFLKKV